MSDSEYQVLNTGPLEAPRKDIHTLPIKLDRQSESPALIGAPVKQAGFFKKMLAILASKLGMSLLCTGIITLLTRSTTLWAWLRVLCAFIGLLGDEKVTKTVKIVMDKVEPTIHSAPVDPANPSAEKPTIKEKITGAVAGKAVEKVTAPIKDAAQTATRGVEKVGEKVTDAADKVADKLGDMKEKHAEVRAEAKARAEEIEKHKLLTQASQLGLECDEDWPIERLRSEVREAAVAQEKEKTEAYLEWWLKNGENGMCPYCHRPIKVSLRGNGRVACRNGLCQANFSSSQARQQGAPPPPRIAPPAFISHWNARKSAKQQVVSKGKGREMIAMRRLARLLSRIVHGYWSPLIGGMARALTVGALICGCLAMLYLGGRSPEWMLKGEVLIVLTFALVYGFTAFSPGLPGWLRHREVKGVACVALGCVALFVPAQFLVSSCLIGVGARLVMTSGRITATIKSGGTPISRGRGDIVLRESGGIAMPEAGEIVASR